MQLLDAPLAIVDLETTGANMEFDRVTEIGVIEVESGEVASEWSTLVDPGTAIPPAIQALTGISNDMVAGAPAFADIAEALFERLRGRVFVAHNARFDYGFLRREFARAGLEFSARTLCTVKLSRRLYPEHARHSLDSLIARHGLACQARHRALGDAEAVWRFLQVAAAERGNSALALAASAVARQATLPPHIDRDVIDAIPDSPGVYIFYGGGGAPLYVGNSVALRSRVLSHFAENLRSAREMQLAREVRSIDWQRSAGELGALLREAQLVKELAPAYNRRLRRPHELCGFAQENGVLRLARADELDAASVTRLRGAFRSRRAALAALRGLADQHGLCLQSLGFDAVRAGKGPCFRHQIRLCAGVCAGRESAATHQARVAAALAGLETMEWPYRGPIGVVEKPSGGDDAEVHLVHHWCYLGTARSDAELAELLEDGARPAFDLDQYRILARHLAKGRPQVVDLAN